MRPDSIIHTNRLKAELQTLRAVLYRCLIHEAVFNQRPKSRESVAPGDLLAFGKIAPVIRDRHLVEFVFALENFGGNLRLEIEAVRFNMDVFDHVGAEDFITGLHVREDRVVKQVGDESEHLVADEMLEVERPRHLGARKTRAVDDVGAPFENGLYQLGVFGRVIFQIGVLNNNDVASGVSQRGPERRAFTHILGVEIDLVRPGFAKVVQYLASAVLRRVVNDDQLSVDFAQIDRLDAPDDLVNRIRLVVNGHLDGKKGRILHLRISYFQIEIHAGGVRLNQGCRA